MKRKLLVYVACGLLIGLWISPAQAVSVDYPFSTFQANDPLNALAQTHMLVTDDFSSISVPVGFTADVGFKFTTTFSPAVITDVGFYDGSILGTTPVWAMVDSGSNVAFSQSGDQNWSNTYFGTAASVQFSAAADNPAPTYGVSAGEYLWVLFDLAAGKTAQDVVNALNLAIDAFGPYSASNPFPEGGLAVALKLQSVGPGSYSTEGVNVPIPPSALLLGSGLLGLGLVGWRRKKGEA